MVATGSPVNVHTFKAQVKDLEMKNAALKARADKLEQIIQARQIKVVPSKAASS
jgi:hypothetical protein